MYAKNRAATKPGWLRDYGLVGGEKVKISTAKGFQFLKTTGGNELDEATKKKVRANIAEISVVREYPSYILFNVHVDDGRINYTYPESINKFAFVEGRAWVDILE